MVAAFRLPGELSHPPGQPPRHIFGPWPTVHPRSCGNSTSPRSWPPLKPAAATPSSVILKRRVAFPRTASDGTPVGLVRVVREVCGPRNGRDPFRRTSAWPAASDSSVGCVRRRRPPVVQHWPLRRHGRVGPSTPAEIGVRVALGATATDVRRLVLGEALRLTVAGASIGLALAFAATRALEGLLFETHALDPATLLTATLVLVGTLMLASYLPARRATQMDPVDMLRAE